MKKVLLFVLPLFLFSCKSALESNRQAIETLNGDWEKITTSLTSLSESITNDVNGVSSNLTQLMLDDAAKAKLKGDAAANYDKAVEAVKSASSQAYGPVQTEVNEFVKMWVEKSASVKALTDGLASGKYEGNVVTDLADLSGLVTQAKEKITAWTAKSEEAKKAVEMKVAELKTVYDAIAPKK
ncbi:MAG: hypothetical protein J5I52_06740 [Saprospiraceae bacterium]|nr:hypothetical protein [Saprospiraceae bacterium]MCZ2339368.1 hypothetical protein [Chitinophagales bacterium]